ncbi:Phosphoserine phosphatase SerB [Pseudomonas syringae pv. atrofaciens]|jgi:phosphoserine phosphatase|uniref:Phosphoserine phosphatase n=4 Tax=Pseudomonas syringae TaxID=317 RepID=A0AB74ACX7_PSESX|nr:phosphoserine phosphatase [Pseudomonas syringae pv. syringae HS191]AVX24897.1 phosphoserine phosphatase SerB [Pseudomonas syringae pv. atrofaciens]EPF64701.1 Phosphoserine phosphatase SerB [Pseudomonas syringae pv. syringae SM]KPX59895.1 ACT domain-containing protein/phosphoserine phosphatase SerB [Pseudomonas syringae pv. lapsa]KPZ02643.1 Phosphoserine phosphatase SerB [Pseudomonas syringae pv. aptata]MCF5648028.1 phosphoserine phosphatase SerB [Pseudomonas syringae]POQ03256.1 phosphoseri
MWLECGFFPLRGCALREIVLINITGVDRPGLTAAITGVLAQGGVNILDIGQAVIHDTLSFGILVEIPDTVQGSSVLKDILFTAYELDQQVRFTAVSETDYQHWVDGQGKARHIVTLLTRKVTAEQLQCVSAITAKYGLNIDQIDRLSGRMPLDTPADKGKGCIEFTVRGEPADPKAMQAEFLAVAQDLNVDIAFQQDSLFRRNRRLAVFDMDSTLIEAEVIDELAKAAGVGEQVSEITERAMRGELDFSESFKERLALLKGLDVSVLDEIGASLRLTEGAETLFSELKRLGYKTAILSGGFTYFAKQLQAKLGIDYVFANELEVVDGKVTGVAVEPIVNAQRKADLLRELAHKEGLSLEQTIAVGDGANDLPMLAIAGLGVAFRAKPLVKQSAKQAISTLGLDGVLYLLGFRDREGQH